MEIYYSIVPISDGFHYVTLDDKGNHIEIHKDIEDIPTLLFKTEDKANNYITKYLDTNKYVPEEIWLNEKYYSNLPK